MDEQEDYSIDIDAYTFSHDLDEYDLYAERLEEDDYDDSFDNLILE